MKRFSPLTIAAALCLLGANAFAQGATEKVTGEFTRTNCFDCQPGDDLSFISHRLLNAHEESDKHPQKGFMFVMNDAGIWFELDFTDTHNTCVNVFEDGRARIGGLVQDGNGPQVGRTFGFYLEDQSGPAYFSDKTHTVRFTLDRWSDDARDYLHHWCQTDELLGDPLRGYAVWFGIVIDGNFVVHNSPRDGD